MYNLYIDDERTPSTNGPDGIGWTIVRSYNDAVDFITAHGFPKYISFDNDLGGDLEGHHIAKWIVEYSVDIGQPLPKNFNYNVHSANPCSRANIDSHFSSYYKMFDRLFNHSKDQNR